MRRITVTSHVLITFGSRKRNITPPDTLHYMKQDIVLRTKGILPVQKLKELVNAGIINAPDEHPIEGDQFQPNSIDLRLGEKAYRVRSSFLPENETVHQKIEKLHQYSFSIEEGSCT